MDVFEYPLLNYPDLMLAILKSAAEGEARLDDCLARLRRNLDRVHEHPPVTEAELLERLERARRYLVEAALIVPGTGGRFRITERGRLTLHQNPAGIDDTVLMRFPEFRAFIHRAAAGPAPADARAADYDLGYAAFRQGKALADNPFDFDTIRHLAWENGWFEARDEDADQRPA